MQIIDDEKQYNEIWNKFQKVFNFKNNCFEKKYTKIFNLKNKDYKIYIIDDKNDFVLGDGFQDGVNAILKQAINQEMYAIDCNHDIWKFNPNENITLNQSGWGNDNSQMICEGFPCYYPAGDDFFFVTKDFSKGILCVSGFDKQHPLMFVIGQDLIRLFEKEKQNLCLIDYSK